MDEAAAATIELRCRIPLGLFLAVMQIVLGVASCVGHEAFLSTQETNLKPSGPCLTTDQLLGQAQWLPIVKQLMHEVIGTARALGYELAEDLADRMVEKTKTMGADRPSTLIDFECQRPLEWRTMFSNPLEHARNTHAETPILKRLTRVIEILISQPNDTAPV